MKRTFVVLIILPFVGCGPAEITGRGPSGEVVKLPVVRAEVYTEHSIQFSQSGTLAHYPGKILGQSSGQIDLSRCWPSHEEVERIIRANRLELPFNGCYEDFYRLSPDEVKLIYKYRDDHKTWPRLDP